ncbi:MAG TPA: AI-2E family transporter [Gemmatimonadales bacterium]|nr:AI-2E family transporter [Gemmatimonadales bacterium]
MSSLEARTHAALPGRRSVSLLIVASVAAGIALDFAQEIFIPIALGLLFAALFRPVVRVLSGFRIPAPATATLVVLGCLGVFGTSVLLFSRPVRAWISEAPRTLAAARGKLEKLRRPIKQVSQAVEKVQNEVTGAEEKPHQPQAAADASSPAIPPFVGRVFATTTGILGTLVSTIVIVFLLLATGDLFTRKLAAVIPKPVTGTAVGAVDDAEAVMRRYLVVTALINAGQALVVVLVMTLIGMPNPALWGLLTFVFEFLPYIGALFMVVALTITGFATFDSLGHVLLAPIAYITISTIQNNAVSPFAYGSGLRVNPLVVLLGVLVGWFLWGVAGAFVAVPLLAAVKLFAVRSGRDSRLATILDE